MAGTLRFKILSVYRIVRITYRYYHFIAPNKYNTFIFCQKSTEFKTVLCYLLNADVLVICHVLLSSHKGDENIIGHSIVLKPYLSGPHYYFQGTNESPESNKSVMRNINNPP